MAWGASAPSVRLARWDQCGCAGYFIRLQNRRVLIRVTGMSSENSWCPNNTIERRIGCIHGDALTAQTFGVEQLLCASIHTSVPA
jgi:hypothetical protein